MDTTPIFLNVTNASNGIAIDAQDQMADGNAQNAAAILAARSEQCTQKGEIMPNPENQPREGGRSETPKERPNSTSNPAGSGKPSNNPLPPKGNVYPGTKR